MTISQLRTKHPRFIYSSYEYHWTDDEDLEISFSFTIDPDITFTPSLTIKGLRMDEDILLDSYVFNLGMIEAISYWKSVCAKEFIVRAGYLSQEQILFWHDLYIYGLGEFYYVNDIDFTGKDFMSFRVEHPEEALQLEAYDRDGAVLLASGGKDSSVTLELLKSTSMLKEVLMLNPLPAAKRVVEEAGYTNTILGHRHIDPKLIELNSQGYLNGHTPFSAYLAFLGLLVARVQGRTYVIASNERSSSEGNILYRGIMVNHQYSKSFDYERRMTEYVVNYMSLSTKYFSFLRPLHDLQVTKLFSRMPEYHTLFRSCNVNQKQDSWCKKCAKCAFVYLSLFPFLSSGQMNNIFQTDLFEDPIIVDFINDIVTPGNVKPLECVGTEKESLLAVALSVKKYERENLPIPKAFTALIENLSLDPDKIITEYEHLLKEWGSDQNLPDVFVNILKTASIQ